LFKDELTPREKEAARIAAAGASNAEVAQRMGVSEGTVKQYLNHAYDKLGVWNRYQLTYKAESLK
jgi:DNA-binding CsgD family transcriptional regulator